MTGDDDTAFPWDAWWRFARTEAHLSDDEFWASTPAQLIALLPAVDAAPGVERGTAADLMALAGAA